GKSSLLNALAGDEVAIVTDIAGTTRDAVRERILIDGVPVHIVDTAGLRETDDGVERIGIERSRKAVSEADVALVLVDPREGVNDKTRAILDALPPELKRIEIHSKSDLHAHAAGGVGTGAETVIALSAKTG
ncbi:50S ribosome-binding GTPase, partial [Klebsiella pneumoniae]|nr:50S ribosome-binding GTPase [Klebsiella pneumoniae]